MQGSVRGAGDSLSTQPRPVSEVLQSGAPIRAGGGEPSPARHRHSGRAPCSASMAHDSGIFERTLRFYRGIGIDSATVGIVRADARHTVLRRNSPYRTWFANQLYSLPSIFASGVRGRLQTQPHSYRRDPPQAGAPSRQHEPILPKEFRERAQQGLSGNVLVRVAGQPA
jgi:hypothetical protein